MVRLAMSVQRRRFWRLALALPFLACARRAMGQRRIGPGVRQPGDRRLAGLSSSPPTSPLALPAST
jgi:hypothetical protein